MNSIQKRICVIINPVSGTRSKKDIPGYFNKLDSKDFDVKMFTTKYPGHATEIAREAVESKTDYVVAVGGDGTINETARALIGSGSILGIIAVGSGNGLARSLRIPMDRSKAFDIIQKGYFTEIDYGLVNDSVFLCTCGVGFDAQVSEKSLDSKKRGKLMYTKNMVSTYRQFKPEKYKIITPGQTLEQEAFLITCANASQYGNNAYIAPKASLEDGLLNIAILKPISAFHIPQMAIQMFSQNIGNNRRLIEMISPEVTIIRKNEGVMHLDGNAVYTGKEIKIKIVHRGLKVLIPSSITQSRYNMQSIIKSAAGWV